MAGSETIPNQEVKQKVRRTRWDQPPESSSDAGNPTAPEEAAGNPTAPEEAPTEYVMLTNMFDPEIEEQREIYLDIRDEVQEQCCKIGAVVQGTHFDRRSGGFCFRFDSNRSAVLAKNKLNGRVALHGKSIIATYLEERRYKKRYER